jgi:hypothetical protein
LGIPSTGLRTARSADSDASVLGVFEGITACSEATKVLPQISDRCEMMIWKITFHQDPDKLTPTTYELRSAYGFSKPGTPGLAEGATRIDVEGTWAIVKGADADPDAVVYQLDSASEKNAVYLLKLDENILHVLDQDRSLMVGNAAWSYTLNRTNKRLSAPQSTHRVFQTTRTVLEPIDSPMLGVFDGRVPCHEVALAFAGIPANPACQRIKWRLTLYQEPNTDTPTIYKLQGTRTIREGAWSIVRGTKADPDAIVYKLELVKPETPITSVYFLKADDNHLMLLDGEGNLLVGDAILSYTLSRGDDTF